MGKIFYWIPWGAGRRREEDNISLLSKVGRRLARVWGHFFASSGEHSSTDIYKDNIRSIIFMRKTGLVRLVMGSLLLTNN